VEVQKAKDKPKKIETVALDELVDVKGWKAIGNRLSEYKVTKVNLVQDEESAEQVDDEIEIEATDEDQSPKKKELEPTPDQQKKDHNKWLDDGEQATLFAAPEKPKHQLPQGRPEPKIKVKAEQQSLFGTVQKSSPPQSESRQQNENESEEEKIVESSKEETSTRRSGGNENGDDTKSFGVGDTVEFDL